MRAKVKSPVYQNPCYTNWMTMRPLIIGIGGGHSNSGKTTLVCAILKEFPGWSAIKCGSDSMYTSVIDDPEILSEPGTDTSAYLEAGASSAVLVKASAHEMAEALDIALQNLDPCPGVVIEGNSAIEVLKPDIVIFSFDAFGRLEQIKESAQTVFAEADALVYRNGTPDITPDITKEPRPVFKNDETKQLVAFIKERLNERRDH